MGGSGAGLGKDRSIAIDNDTKHLCTVDEDLLDFGLVGFFVSRFVPWARDVFIRKEGEFVGLVAGIGELVGIVAGSYTL